MLYRIVLHMGRNPAFPAGSAAHGYDLIAPLTGDGHLDAVAWRASKDRCRVRRFWAGYPDRHGLLVHKDSGSAAERWMIDYDRRSADDDETGFNLDRHVFARDEFITISDRRGEHAFRIVAVEPLTA